MPSRDYLIRQIEEMGYFLALLLNRILKRKAENQEEQMETDVREALIQKMELDIDQVIIFENEEFYTLIKEHFKSEGQLEKLADILKTLGQEIEHSFTLTRAAYLQKSLFLFRRLQVTTSNFSMERQMKIQELEELITRVGINDQ
jgi:ribosomal protein S24E